MASSQIYEVVAKAALRFLTEQSVHGALDFFNILVDSHEVDFVLDDDFAGAFADFVSDIPRLGPVLSSEHITGIAVEILFGIAAKIRLRPEVLNVWFVPKRKGAHAFPEATSDLESREAYPNEFPLFYLLLSYVHYDGRIGDFARTGLLYLIESTAHSEDLEKWVVESELAALMASGIGALYSRLNR